MLLLRASGASRWVHCDLSVTQVAGQLSEDDTDDAREGTCAAWVGEMCINQGREPFDMVGEMHANGWVVDVEMARHLVGYVALARSRTKPQAEVYHEAVIGDVKLAGTSDLHSWDFPETGRVFCIDDLKYGYDIHEPTSKQVLAYLALWVARQGGIVPHDAKVQLGIYQPRAIHPDGIYRTIELSAGEIQTSVQTIWDRMFNLNASLSDLGKSAAGPWCNHCNKAHICPALTQSVYSMWTPLRSRGILEPTPNQLSDEATMLRAMEKVLKARKTGVEAELTGLLERGTYVPGWVRERRTGKRKFTQPASVIKMMTGVDAAASDTCTPAELERRGASPEAIAALTEKPYIGHVLTPVTPQSIGKHFKRPTN